MNQKDQEDTDKEVKKTVDKAIPKIDIGTLSKNLNMNLANNPIIEEEKLFYV
jgi:hypothetical protein